MARAALGWSLDDLALKAGVDRRTILYFERGERTPRTGSLVAIRRAFDEAGVRFIEDGGIFPPL